MTTPFQLPTPVEVVTPELLEHRLAETTPTDIITRAELLKFAATLRWSYTTGFTALHNLTAALTR